MILILIVIVVAITQYGGGVRSLFNRPNAKRDIQITKAEFRAELGTARPIWIIGFRNTSRQFTYDVIQMEATYFDGDGRFMERDTLVVHQKLDPLQETSLASPDLKQRPRASLGTLSVIDAQRVK